jgi:adenylate cyclase
MRQVMRATSPPIGWLNAGRIAVRRRVELTYRQRYGPATLLTSNIEQRFHREMLKREERAERFACLLWLAVILITYGFFLLETDFDDQLRSDIGLLVSVTIPGFLALLLVIRFGYYRPFFAYMSSLLQLSVVTGAIYFDTKVYGTQYALSSMPPIAYGLVIIVTAFRLRPFMGVFAGGIAAAQFLLIYTLVSRKATDITPALLEQIPSLDWEVTMMKVVILLGLGVASSFSAYSLRKELYNFIATAEQELRLHQSLGRYASAEVADAMRSDQKDILAPRKKQVAVMFGDIRNFTRFSSQHTPEQVASLVNRFFDHADLAIGAHHGVLNKFLGDGFMAVFGMFEEESDPRINAVKAGLDILRFADQELKAYELDAGIAVNFGEVVAGEIGSEGRVEFTVLGNTVNIAARLEGLNRKLRTRFLATKEFAEYLPDGFVGFESRGTHEIRGIADKIELVEFTGLVAKESA